MDRGRPPTSIPGDEFYGDQPPAPAPFAFEDDELAAGFSVEPPPAPPKPEMDGGAFFPRAPPPPDRTFARWAARPLLHGVILTFVGFVGTLVLASPILWQIVIGAPVFEELWKFGIALVLVALFRVDSGPARVLVALTPGIGFGIFEHFLTYPDEPVSILLNRVVFHSGSTAMSMAVYHAIAPVWDPRVRFVATIPATLIHWANNFAAVVLGLASVVAEEPANVTAVVLTFSIAGLAHIGAWSILAGQRQVRGAVLRMWVRHAPEDLRA